jgi:hypothetical protein
MLRALRIFHRDERGANMFVVISLCFAFVLITPFFVDFSSFHYSRRTSQTGADAGAQAAAVEYAKRYNLTYTMPVAFEGMCGETPTQITMRYWSTVVLPLYAAQIGAAPAYSYAARHRCTVDRYQQYLPSPSGYFQVWAGVPIWAIGFYVHNWRPTYLIYQNLYGGAFPTPAKATGEAYPFSYTVLPRPPCGKIPRYAMEYRWKVRLIRTIE